MPNIRFGVRYSKDPLKGLEYLQLQQNENPDFARPGELFINEPLNKVFYCNSTSGLIKDLTPAALDQLEPEDIKALYELNEDTNVLDDNLLTKLQALGRSDWDATTGWAVIENKPEFGSAAFTEVSDYATAAQGAKADTAVQPAENISKLTNDVGYITSAQAPVQPSDLTPYAPLVNPSFTGNNLILPNNSRINNIEHFYQSTKPTVRGDASDLVIGDRWWKTNDGTEWFWNGTYWLSPSYYCNTGLRTYSASVSVGSPFTTSPGLPVGDILVKNIEISISGLFADGSNYWVITPSYCLQTAGSTISFGVSRDLSTFLTGTEDFSINTFISRTAGSLVFWRPLTLSAVKVGSPGNLNFSLGCNYQYVA